MLVFVGIFVESPQMDEVVRKLDELSSLEYLCEVAGEFDIIILVSVENISEFRDILVNQIMKINGVRSTVSSVVMRTHLRSQLSEFT